MLERLLLECPSFLCILLGSRFVLFEESRSSMKAIKRIVVAAFLLAPLVITLSAKSQSQTQPQQQPPPPEDKSKEAAEEGIAVKSQLVIDRCASCHKKDDKG